MIESVVKGVRARSEVVERRGDDIVVVFGVVVLIEENESACFDREIESDNIL